eukprot:TRINITY_DN2088_c0_g3_i3.p1 TRINITY_DN2088_c0_g3~~TRINITY_DN2088_c0_g3_i3.p1  ORF type:complete len:583 (+),score=151.48 TRINITY_DN2088_c0_g3_i3:716-2464(+)
MSQKLLELGADTNARDAAGETPLHFACRSQCKEIITLLLEHGANLDSEGTHGTPLDVAPEEIKHFILDLINDSKGTPRATHTSAKFQSSKWQVDMNQVEWGEFLGEGSFGKVYRGKWQGLDVAIKAAKLENVNPRTFEVFGREIALMSRLNSPNILLLIGASLEPARLCYLTEYMPNGNLHDYLVKNPNLPWCTKFYFAVEMAQAIQYLHGSIPPILHRDLKSTNVLVDINEHIKVADFGISKPKELNQTPGFGCTTLNWCPPEILSGKEPTEKSDVYSYAVICWELISHEIPYKGKQPIEIIRSIENNKTLEIPKSTNPNYSQILNSCWQLDPSNRPHIHEVYLSMKTLSDDHRRQMRSNDNQREKEREEKEREEKEKKEKEEKEKDKEKEREKEKERKKKKKDEEHKFRGSRKVDKREIEKEKGRDKDKKEREEKVGRQGKEGKLKSSRTGKEHKGKSQEERKERESREVRKSREGRESREGKEGKETKEGRERKEGREGKEEGKDGEGKSKEKAKSHSKKKSKISSCDSLHHCTHTKEEEKRGPPTEEDSRGEGKVMHKRKSQKKVREDLVREEKPNRR